MMAQTVHRTGWPGHLALAVSPASREPDRSVPACGEPIEREVNEYLTQPLRTLEQACRDIVKCAGVAAPACASCRLADLCPVVR